MDAQRPVMAHSGVGMLLLQLLLHAWASAPPAWQGYDHVRLGTFVGLTEG
jgi:hypothetical protein